MEDNLSEGGKSITHDATEENLEKTDSISKKEISETKVSIKCSITDSYTSLKKDSSSIKERNSVKDSVKESTSSKDSTSLKKSQRSSSLKSAASELISVKEPVSEKNITESPLSKSQSSQVKSVKSSSSNIKSIMSQKLPSEYSAKVSFLEMPSTISVTEKGTTRSDKLNLNQVSEEAMPSTVKKCDYRNALQTDFPGSSSYISPWAKSSSTCKLTKSQSSTKADEMKEEFKPKCIPPWAKTLRKFYGMSCPDTSEDLGPSQNNLQEKIKNLMDKHSRLMLIKRGESRKQLIVKPSEGGGIGTVKMASKNTRYYMTPIPRDVEDPFLEKDPESTMSEEKISTTKGSEIMALTKKTSRSLAKKEVSSVLKSLYNSKKPKEMESDDKQLRNKKTNCLKITPSKIRDYVNAQALDSDGQKLHEIIKIKKVPSYGAQLGKKPSSKYIINVPKSSKDDGTTVKKITVKEKRKIRIDSVEDINENTTEIIYNQLDSKKQHKPGSQYTEEEHIEHDVVPYSKRRKSPTKTRTLEVTAESTPIISDLLKKEEKNRDKILLIQYEKKSKPCKEKSESEKPTLISTQLLGIRQPCNETLKEMYLYGTETDGKKCKERITQIDDVSPTLREKVNLIFQELREMTFKPCEELESTEKLGASVCSKTTQHPSLLVETDAVSVQALPEVRSAEVQVNDSVLFTQSELAVTQTITPASQTEEDKEDRSSEQGKEGEQGKESIDELKETSDDLSTKIVSKPKKSLLDSDSDQPIGKPIDDLEDEKEEKTDGELTKTDETILSETDEKVISEESKVLRKDTKSQDKAQVDESEDKNIRDEKDETERKITQEDSRKQEDQEDMSHVDYQDGQEKKLSEETAEEHLEEEQNYEALEDKETRLSKEEKDLYTEDITKSDDLLVGKQFEGIDKDEEVDGRKKDTTEEGDVDSYEGKDKAGNVPTHMLMEDIRSYDFDPAQDFELKMINSSKFFHQKDSLRKLNWTEDTLFLEKNTCPQLIKALAEIALRQPEDPIAYLAHWIYKDYQNRESDEQNSVFKEHIEVAKGMLNTKKDEKLVSKKFSLRRYPMKSCSSVVSPIASERSLSIIESEIEE